MAVAAALTVLLGFRAYFLGRTSRRHRSTRRSTFTVRVQRVARAVRRAGVARRGGAHRDARKLGQSARLAVLIVVALNAAVHGARRDIAAGYATESLRFFSTPVLAMAMFASLVALAVAWRAKPETHKSSCRSRR
jgi:hypothetical protein